MKRITMVASVFLVTLLCGCPIMSPPTGAARIDFSLTASRQLGYDVSQVHCTLTHQGTGKTVERDLAVQGDTASGVIGGLRIGTWELLVDLYEDGVVVGSATELVEISRDSTARVLLQIALATGDLEVIASWESGGMVLEIDLHDLILAEYEVAEVHYTLTHTASGETKVGTAVPEDDVVSIEVPALMIGTWEVEVELWEADGLEPLAGTTTDIDVEPGTTSELTLAYPQTYPLELEILRPAGPFQLYGWPDLKVVNLNAPETAAAGEPIGAAVFVDVLNDGIGISPASASDGAASVGFYLSESPVVDASSTFLASAEVETPIQADAMVEVPVPVELTIPAGTPDGDYYLAVAVDEEEEITELSEANNTASVPITVETIVGISGESIVHVYPALGITISLTFVSETPVHIVDANWDWSGGSVWLDVDDAYSMAPLENNGVDSVVFHWDDPPVTIVPSNDVQTFGYYPTGFDRGDLYEFSAELDVGTAEFHTGYPAFENLEGGVVVVEFSDGTILEGVFDTHVPDEPWSALATLSGSP